MTDAAYFISPVSGPGPGVLLLHSWWGLTPAMRRLADRLSDRGYSVLAPDLNVGQVFEDQAAAERHLADADVDHIVSLVRAAALLLQEKSTGDRIAVVGLSMGASLALWASARFPEVIGAVSAFYGTQAIDFGDADAAYQIHLAGSDALVDDDEAAFMQATMGLESLAVDVWVYPGTEHWFFESDRPEYHPVAAEQAWDRLVGFLGDHLGSAERSA